MFVFGTRPEAIKMAPVIKEVEKYPDILEPIVVVTGQHRQMLDQVLRIFSIDPDYDLCIMEENQTIVNIVTKYFPRARRDHPARKTGHDPRPRRYLDHFRGRLGRLLL